MQININSKYDDFFHRTKNEPFVILKGSKRSGKTYSILQHLGFKFIQENNLKIQFFTEGSKQQGFGLLSDYQNIFKPIIPRFYHNDTRKIYRYKDNELAFINIDNNVNANDTANSLGAASIRYVNECHNRTESFIDNLRINNQGQMFFDYNPYREFWINKLITDTNFLKTTWRDNERFLTKKQVLLFQQWTNEGMNSPVGSYAYWRWQVMCEGEYCQLTGKLFTTDNIRFIDKLPDGLHNFIIFADPSNAKGNDYFALTLTAIGADGKCYLIDSFSCNRIEKVLIAEKIKQWQRDNIIQRTFIETNGEFGLKFYNDCVLAGIPVDGWYSRQDKFERIIANYDVITEKLLILDTPQNRDFAQQIYTFRSPDKKEDENDTDKNEHIYDDNIDCLNNAILAYITVFCELKVLF